MERKQFFQIIDQLAANWYIDTIEPATNTVVRADGSVVSGARQREMAKDREGPNWSGWVNIMNWQPNITHCHRCQTAVPNCTQSIDLKKRKVKCYGADGKIRCSFNLSDKNLEINK